MIPRKLILTLNVPCEHAIRNSIIEVEKLEASPECTETIILLNKALTIVSYLIDKKINEHE